MANIDMKSESTVKPIRTIVDAWAETELGKEVQDGYAAKPNLNSCWKRVTATREDIAEAKDSFMNILLKQAFGDYHMLDKHVGRSEKIVQFSRSDMLSY